MHNNYPTIRTNDLSLIPLKLEINRYLNENAGSNAHTLWGKSYDLNYFLDFVEQFVPDPSISSVTYSHCCAFRDDRLAIESPNTVQRRLSTLKHFWRVVSHKYRIPDPSYDVRRVTFTLPEPRRLAPDEEVRLRNTAFELRQESWTSMRAWALIETLLETGLRAGEASFINAGQIDRLGFFRKVRCKAGKYLDKPISDRLIGVLAEYLPHRDAELKARFERCGVALPPDFGDYPLFPSVFRSSPPDRGSFRLSLKTIWVYLTDCCEKAGIDPVSAHVLRHTFAYDILESGTDIRAVAQLLGHSDMKVTMRYTEHRQERLREFVNIKNERRAA